MSERPEPGLGARVGEAVVVAALTALVGGLVEWAIQKMRDRRERRARTRSKPRRRKKLDA